MAAYCRQNRDEIDLTDSNCHYFGINCSAVVSRIEGDVYHSGLSEIRVEIEITSKMDPWPKNPDTESLFTIWEQASAALDFQVYREARGGLSDGNHTWNTIPTIDGLGPMGRNGHCSERSADGSKDQEYVNKSSFVPKTVLNFTAIRKLIALH